MTDPSLRVEPLLNKPSSQEGLKPCPFCGKPPETQRSGDGQKGLMINCITPGCVNPHVSYYDHATAIRVWNTRHPSFNDAIEGFQLLAANDGNADQAVAKRALELIADIQALAPYISPFRTGDRAKHAGRDEDGTVTILENGNVQVLFDNPNSRGRPSIGIYDANWFKMNPNGLRSLKLPDYRGGEAKTAESEHSPSTREG